MPARTQLYWSVTTIITAIHTYALVWLPPETHDFVMALRLHAEARLGAEAFKAKMIADGGEEGYRKHFVDRTQSHLCS